MDMAAACPEGESSIIPQEVIDATIDFLGEDPTSLQAVGLVQKAWYPRTREHLFYEVSFGGEELGARSMKLKGLLEDSPTLAQFIKQLTFKNYPRPSDLSHFVDIIPLLTSLTGFTVECMEGFDWALLSDEMATSLQELMSNPRMERVILIGITNMDIAPLSQCHNLRELIFWDVTPPSEPSVSSLKPRASLPVPPTPDDHLHFLQLYDCGKVLKTLIAHAESADGTLDIFRPTTLNIDTNGFDDDMAEALDTIVHRGGAFVETYDVSHNSPLFPAQAFTALRQFPRLVTFSVTLCFRTADPLPLLIDELEHLSHSNAPRDLLKIRLIFEFRIPDMDPGDVHDINEDVQALACRDFWAELDRLLVKPAFPAFKILLIGFDTRDCDLELGVWEEARNTILCALENLAARPGIIQLTRHFETPDFSGIPGGGVASMYKPGG